jgi:hypothetical protein
MPTPENPLPASESAENTLGVSRKGGMRRNVKLTPDTLEAVATLQAPYYAGHSKKLSFAAALNTLACDRPHRSGAANHQKGGYAASIGEARWKTLLR